MMIKFRIRRHHLVKAERSVAIFKRAKEHDFPFCYVDVGGIDAAV